MEATHPTDPASLTSVEKVQQLAYELAHTPAEGEQAMLYELASMALPHVLKLLPTDPAELDAQLDQLAAIVVGLKSDPEALPTVAAPQLDAGTP